jgi:hypothetical protein
MAVPPRRCRDRPSPSRRTPSGGYDTGTQEVLGISGIGRPVTKFLTGRCRGALEEECARLVALGATRLRRDEPEPPLSAGFIFMADPEGNEFCLD